MKDSKNGKLIGGFVLALIVLFVFFQFYNILHSPITTGSVTATNTFNGIDLEVISIRDEKVLQTSKSGVLSYNIEDGGKVAKNGIVAYVYNDKSDANLKTEIEQLENTIKDLENINGYNNSEAIDIDALDIKINKSILEMVNSANSGAISNVSEPSQELLKLLNRRQIATGISGGFDDLLREYKSKLKILKSKKDDATAKVKSKIPGYFVSGIDGYETVLSSDDIDDITPDFIKNTKPVEKEYANTVVGKLVSDYEWYLAARISLDDSLKFKEGSEMVLKTNFESVPELPVTVLKLNKGDFGDEAVVIFTCNYMNSELATMRTAKMTAVIENYSGLGVNARAVRFVDGKKGVFVLTGNIINFVPVNVLYSKDNLCICEKQTTGLRLKLYDEVVIKGKNLYDGKVIN